MRRALPGRWGITLQCDPAQVKAKRAPSTGAVRAKPAAAPRAVAVYRDFNPDAFNFNKCKQEETLFCLDVPPRPSATSSADTGGGGGKAGEDEADSKAGDAGGDDSEAGGEGTALTAPPHAVLVNVSPLFDTHSLLLLCVPRRAIHL